MRREIEPASLEKKRKREQIACYLLFSVGIIVLFSRYLPVLQDWYILRENSSFQYLLSDIYTNQFYRFEGLTLFFLMLGLWMTINHLGISVLIMSIILFVLTYASNIKFMNRRELLRISDFRLTEAAGMAAKYLLIRPDFYFWVMLLFFVFLIFFAFLIERKYKVALKVEDKRIKKRYFRIRFVVVVLCAGVVCCYFCSFMNHQRRVNAVDAIVPNSLNNCRYLLYQFFDNQKIMVGYTEGEIKESYSFFENVKTNREEKEIEEYPNIIVIMNESWMNTDNIPQGKLEFSMDPMGPYRELTKDCSFGYLTANVYGGGTVSSEAEFLTGLNTKYFTSDSGVYEETLEHGLPSVVDYFNALDYETVALHPYVRSFYSRDLVYSKMGFDKKIFLDDMEYTDLYSKFVSDEAFALQIIKEYETREKDQFFLFGVSIANHAHHLSVFSESVKDYPYPIQVTSKESTLTDADIQYITNHINGIYYANLAYKQLVEYFSKQEEPIVLVMYGDHIPNFTRITGTIGFREQEEEDEALKKMYSVPILLWSNCLDDTYRFEGENINYLPQILIDMIGMPSTDMIDILRYQKSVFRFNTRYRVSDAEGNILQYLTNEQIEAISHFKNVQYDLMFGSELKRSIWLPQKEE